MISRPWHTSQVSWSTSTPTPNLQSGSSVDQIYSVISVGDGSLINPIHSNVNMYIMHNISPIQYTMLIIVFI